MEGRNAKERQLIYEFAMNTPALSTADGVPLDYGANAQKHVVEELDLVPEK